MLALQAALRLLDTEGALVIVLLGLPTLAVLGGVVIGVVRAVGQQRQMELAQRERIAAIERGLDPGKVPPPPLSGAYFHQVYGSPAEHARRRYQGLLMSGILTLALGLAMSVLFSIVEQDGESWAIGIVPMMLGAALLLCAWLVRPRDNGQQPHP